MIIGSINDIYLIISGPCSFNNLLSLLSFSFSLLDDWFNLIEQNNPQSTK